MNILIRIRTDEDGDEIPRSEQKWCLADPSPFSDTQRVLCDQQVLEDTISEWDIKYVKKGGITCEKCIETIKKFKSVKL